MKIILLGEPMGLFMAEEPGRLSEVRRFTASIAGAEYNVAVGLARLGHTPAYCTRLGDDPLGQKILDGLLGNGIDTGLVTEAEKILTSKAPLSEFGRLLDWTWKLKRGITDSISTSHIDALYDSALHAGALGGKLLGAGGGGSLLFYVEPEHQQRVREALNELMYVPFRFENRGSSVIFFEPEELPT